MIYIVLALNLEYCVKWLFQGEWLFTRGEANSKTDFVMLKYNND
jgi:hypothetical protein